MTAATRRLAIAVDFDLICPWCWIGLRQLAVARTRFAQRHPAVAVDTTWRPVQLLPDVPAAGVPFATFYERRLGSPEAVQRRQQQVLVAARAVGLDIDFARIATMPNTARAHRLLRAAARREAPARYEALLERLFAAHFRRGEDLGDAPTLQRIAAEAGVPDAAPGAADEDEGLRAVAGGVPHFVFNGGLEVSGARDAATLLEAMSWSLVAPAVQPS